MVNLRLKSDFNFLSSTLTINKIIQLSLQNYYNVASICDTNSMYGVATFYKACLKERIKPLIGVEFSVEINTDLISSLLLFAINEKGYYNLVKLTSKVNEYNTKYLSLHDILANNQDLICVIPNEKLTMEGNLINSYFAKLHNIFKEDLYLGVFRYIGINDESINKLKQIAKTFNIKTIALQKCFHVSKEDTLILNLLDCIKTQTKANRNFLNDDSIVESYFKTKSELRVCYEEEELLNLQKLIDKINVSIPKLTFNLPKLFFNSKEVLEIQTHKALKKYNLDNELYQSRLEYELQVINQMGYADYFLIVSDYVNYAKTHDIMVGPARGSAGASLVSYLLNITTIDPLKYNLIFERFLNPQRISMPDIDIDFLDIKRDDIIEYVKQKYGYKRVSHIVTFSTLGPKSAIRDMARILNVPNNEVDYLLSFYSNDHSTIKETYEKNTKFKEVVDIHSKYKQLISFASNIEGLKRQAGIHAAGIVLHNQAIDELIPTFEDRENDLVTMYDYITVEQIGLLKMDFLGLKNLTIIDDCLKLINKKFNKNYDIDTFQYDYEKIYSYLSLGKTIGIFQLESEGMKRTLMKMKPTSFNDIVSLLALYRPGPMKNIDSYINRKNHSEVINYLHPQLKDILDETYGIIVYQEQIMNIVTKLASFTMAEADIFRKAITKKNANTISEQKQKFLDGCLKNEINKSNALAIYSLIEAFAEYGFNKAHSVGYAKIALIMAAIKCSYPLIFYTILLNLSLESESKKIAIFNEASYFNIRPAFPSINHSDCAFSFENERILFGLSSINNINNKIAQIIIDERKNGLFMDIYDFVIRMVKSNINIAAIENLIYSGALDEFNISRPIMINNLSALYSYGEMFKNLPYKANDYKAYSYLPKPYLDSNISNLEIDFLKKEKELLGIYISSHPLSKIKENYLNITDINHLKGKTRAQLIGIVNSIGITKSKKGKDYLFLVLEDETNNVRLTAYDNQIQKYKIDINKNDIIKVNITIRNNDFYLIEKIEKISGGFGK